MAPQVYSLLLLMSFQTISASPRLAIPFRGMVTFELEDHPFSAVYQCAYSNYNVYLEAIKLHLQPEDAPCRCDREKFSICFPENSVRPLCKEWSFNSVQGNRRCSFYETCKVYNYINYVNKMQSS